MAHKQNSPALQCGNIMHFAKAFSLKLYVSDSQHLVHNEDFGLEMGGDGKGQAHIHAAGVTLDWCVQELLDLGERDDLIELPLNFCLAHPENGSVQVNVFPAGQLLMKAGPHFEQTRHATPELNATFGGFGNPAKDL